MSGIKFAFAIVKELGYGLEGATGPSASTITPGKNITAAAVLPTRMAAARALSDLPLVRLRDSGIFAFFAQGCGQAGIQLRPSFLSSTRLERNAELECVLTSCTFGSLQPAGDHRRFYLVARQRL